MRNIVLLAVQGAGKGTLAKALEKKYNYAHISTGDILRKRVAECDEFGNQIKDLIHNGILVSDDVIFEIIEDRLSQADCKNGFILDGLPRTLEQAKRYEELSKRLGIDEGIIINMVVPTDVVVERIVNRRVCLGCAKIYNITIPNKRPTEDGKCHDCGGEVVSRDDDSNEEAIRRRIGTYHENAESIVNFYKEKGVLFNVDATDTDHTITEVEEILKDFV